MMKIAFAVAAAAAVLAPAPLFVGSVPAEAQDLKMARSMFRSGGTAIADVIQVPPSASAQVALPSARSKSAAW